MKALEMSPWMLLSVRRHLFAQFPKTAFSTLTTLTFTSGPLARSGNFTVSHLFEILSLTPVLKRLHFGAIGHVRALAGVESLRNPACSLESLSASQFAHYTLLLSRSYDSLVELSVRSTLGLRSGEGLQRVLAQCTRVRHLTLLGNQFPSPSIIAVCPRLTSLTLSAAPSEAELAALQGRLRAIEMVSSYTRGTAETFVDAA
ncbi:hypothetical protein AURDEDRAFT_174445 [Auricularia subglabra TFB-10046 SS5]|uniref:RNI-like protein n=1 Tax=Auricularia subglabra (strain TFB-10046 / SS5) TaxID=717982 RepID=J0D9L4_AURST|nr:hypothetical protein AURDEDRAFT_174445 [Auricularia subglabra TFB-10046 SS5]